MSEGNNLEGVINEVDQIRKMILSYLYNVHKRARSLKKTRVGIKVLKQYLRNLGLKEQKIVANLDYLIQSGWVKVENEVLEFKTPKGFIKKQVKSYYKITDLGINYFEGASEFQRVSKTLAGINITNVHGVTVIGEQNVVVNTQFVDLYRKLSLLSEAVRNSTQLSDKEKLEYVAEIETIKNQLAKPSPDKNILKLAWEKLEPLAKISGIASFFKQVAELMMSLI
ncbi:MAG: hypothetical protein QXH32_07045 [Candidatus Caldarchaeum sp.]